MRKLLERVVRLQVYLHHGVEPEAVDMTIWTTDLYFGKLRPTAWRLATSRRGFKAARHHILLHCENS